MAHRHCPHLQHIHVNDLENKSVKILNALDETANGLEKLSTHLLAPRRAGRQPPPTSGNTPIVLQVGVAIIAALSFVGFGVQPPFPDWGLMINENRTGLVVQPWAVLAPALLVAMLAVGVSLIGDGIARAVSGVDERVGQ